ncbi:MAG: hypothetical protein K9M07_05600 [Simkaniaceae bacterium]|nr:hypothetical protein [Simkaniaceae bacterium]
MTLKDIELIFSRAWQKALQKKKCLFLFGFLLLCGIFVVMCHTLGAMSGIWVKLIMYFLPGFLVSGILLALGVFFARIYYNEVKGVEFSYREVLSKSFRLLINVTQVSLPFVMSYLIIWMLMGIFYLLREIPYIGESIGLILSFAPFVLALSSLFLAVLCLFTLFFATPYIAFKQFDDSHFIPSSLHFFKAHVFSHLLLFLIGVLPLIFTLLLLIASASIAQAGLIEIKSPIKSGMQWFFMMIPFTAALTPIVLFFFNFSVESFYLIKKTASASESI